MTANRPPRAAVAAAALSRNEIIDDPRFSYAGDDSERLLPTIEANQRHLNRILAIAFILLARGTENAPRGFLALKSHETAGIFVVSLKSVAGLGRREGSFLAPSRLKSATRTVTDRRSVRANLRTWLSKHLARVEVRSRSARRHANSPRGRGFGFARE